MELNPTEKRGRTPTEEENEATKRARASLESAAMALHASDLPTPYLATALVQESELHSGEAPRDVSLNPTDNRGEMDTSSSH